MDTEGTIYADENPPKEDVERFKEWGDEVEREFEKKLRELEELEKKISVGEES